MAKIEIKTDVTDATILVDGVEMKDVVGYEITHSVMQFPIVKLSVLATDLVVDAPDVEGMIERIPLAREPKVTTDA